MLHGKPASEIPVRRLAGPGDMEAPAVRLWCAGADLTVGIRASIVPHAFAGALSTKANGDKTPQVFDLNM